jgi:hypothetical protein
MLERKAEAAEAAARSREAARTLERGLAALQARTQVRLEVKCDLFTAFAVAGHQYASLCVKQQPMIGLFLTAAAVVAELAYLFMYFTLVAAVSRVLQALERELAGAMEAAEDAEADTARAHAAVAAERANVGRLEEAASAAAARKADLQARHIRVCHCMSSPHTLL